MINRTHKLPISRQAELLGISRGSVYRAGAENLNKAISENLLPFKVREDIRMEQKNEKKSKKKSLTSI